MVRNRDKTQIEQGIKIKEITISNVYNRLAIFFFGTIFLLTCIILTIIKPLPDYAQYIAIGSFVLFFYGYGFLIGDFLRNYLIQTVGFFRKRYEKYKFSYWIIFGILLLIVLGILGCIILGKDKTKEIGLTTAFIAVLGFISYSAKKWYEKKKKPE